MASEVSPHSAQHRAQLALISLLRGRDDVQLDEDARTHRLEQNLIDSITVRQLRTATAQIEQGDGHELRPQGSTRPRHRPPIHSAFSSAALAVNSFAPWLGREDELVIAGHSGFRSLGFEKKCPIFPEHHFGHPNLDLVAHALDGGILAVESKCTEHLGTHMGHFEEAYETKQAEMSTGWLRRYQELRQEHERPFGGRQYSHFDAAQIIKHYLGLKQTFPDQPVTLLYLHWEPGNGQNELVCQRHRDEVDHFSYGLDDPSITFVAEAYPDLWSEWEQSVNQGWLRAVVSELRARYVAPI